MPDPARWFVLVDGEQTGPTDLQDVRSRVRSGAIEPGTWVWADGMPEWRRARQVPALVPPRALALPAWADVERPPAPGT